MSFCVKKLFIQWLTEWKDEAQSNSWKSQYTYGKALRSLKKYPLQVTCGQDVKILEFFGDKLCKMLDKKLAAYKEENGSAPDPSYNSMQTHQVKEKKIAKAPPVPSATREYIPAYRSGPYALIVTLYQDFQDPNSKGFMRKSELQKSAQELSEKSMTVPEPNCHYTAWSSMSTLISKGFVAREGNPSRYTITPAGCDLAHKLKVGHNRTENSNKVSTMPKTIAPRITPPQRLVNKAQEAQDSNRNNFEDAAHVAVDGSYRSSVEAGCFQYTYVDDIGREVCSKDLAVVHIDDKFGVGFLIKCIESELIKFNINHLITTRKAPPGMAYVYIDNIQAADTCPGIKNKPTVFKRSIPDGTKPDLQLKRAKKNYSTVENFSSKSTSSKVSDYLGNNSEKLIMSAVLNSRTDRDCLNNASTSRNSEQCELKEEFTLYAHNFDIILCVDNCEIGGASKRKKQLLEGLCKNNVAIDVRKLQVGDFLWVAREKQNNLIPQLTNKEAVLDYVIERKRMDDLCGSIKDGRFKEQKFRLKQCGIRNAVYLVEDFGSMENMSLPKATLQQAIINTQIVDKFHVKQTCSIQDSVAYLTVMTRYLQSQYSDKTIKAYARENLEFLNNSCDFNAKVQRLMSFNEFNENSIKNKILTTSEVLVKQLLQFSGLTAEKAQAIIKLYPTLSHLLDAYSECETEKECHKLLSTLKFGKAQRNIGPTLSSLIHRMYATPGPLT